MLRYIAVLRTVTVLPGVCVACMHEICAACRFRARGQSFHTAAGAPQERAPPQPRVRGRLPGLLAARGACAVQRARRGGALRGRVSGAHRRLEDRVGVQKLAGELLGANVPEAHRPAEPPVASAEAVCCAGDARKLVDVLLMHMEELARYAQIFCGHL